MILLLIKLHAVESIYRMNCAGNHRLVTQLELEFCYDEQIELCSKAV